MPPIKICFFKSTGTVINYCFIASCNFVKSAHFLGLPLKVSFYLKALDLKARNSLKLSHMLGYHFINCLLGYLHCYNAFSFILQKDN